MGLKFYNTRSRAVEVFEPRQADGQAVGLYCCGPTVYDFGHIGNFRTFVFADLTRRYLEFRGYRVTHVMNITDVEDKIIARVRAAKVPLRDYTARYEQAFLEDLASLHCLRPHHLPHATDHLPEMIRLIEQLLARDMAYRAPDGSVYFSIEQYRAAGRRYGQLITLDFEHMRPGERVQSDEYSKESVADFALWKARVPADGEVFWPSPWGDGRPGWHLECSAMSMKLLGPSFDLHLGGEDLIFPHHEDEIAQSEGATLPPPDRPFVKYWLHGAHLLVEGKKMSKSLGNFFTLRDLLGKGYTGREIRFLLLKGHYRETFNFTLEGLDEARAALARLDECLLKLQELAGPSVAEPAPELVNRFQAALDEDLNISAGWAAVFDWVRDMNRLFTAQQLSSAQAAANLAAWQKIEAVLAVGRKAEVQVPPELQSLLEQRQAARKARDFARSDALREELKAKGWLIEDTPKGPRLKPL